MGVGQGTVAGHAPYQSENMPWREFRVGGMGVCLGVSEARAWRMDVHIAAARSRGVQGKTENGAAGNTLSAGRD